MSHDTHYDCVPRFARAVIPNCPHHVTQRGNQQREVFFNRQDRCVYMGLLKQYAKLYSVRVLGYCLMSNHVHLVLIPSNQDGLAKLFRELNVRYAQYRNAMDRGTGHVWQGRYYSCAVESSKLAVVMRYVELNPVRAGLAERPEEYEWSSAAAHAGAPDQWNLLSLDSWMDWSRPEEWALSLSESTEDAENIRKSTHSGRPYGSECFAVEAEKLLGRRLLAGKRGRPRKSGKSPSVPVCSFEALVGAVDGQQWMSDPEPILVDAVGVEARGL